MPHLTSHLPPLLAPLGLDNDGNDTMEFAVGGHKVQESLGGDIESSSDSDCSGILLMQYERQRQWQAAMTMTKKRSTTPLQSQTVGIER